MIELVRDFIKTNILSKFEEDWIKNVASRVTTLKLLTHAGRRTTTHAGQPMILIAHPELCSGELKNTCTVLQQSKLTILSVSLRFAPDLVAVKLSVQTGSKLSKP